MAKRITLSCLLVLLTAASCPLCVLIFAGETAAAATRPQPTKRQTPLDLRQFRAIGDGSVVGKTVLWHDPRSRGRNVQVAIGLPFGSMADGAAGENTPGLAHLLEHSVFLGSENFPSASSGSTSTLSESESMFKNSFEGFLLRSGGAVNAATYRDAMCFALDIPAPFFPSGFLRLVDAVFRPELKEAAIKNEIFAVNAEHIRNLNDDNHRIWNTLFAHFQPPLSLFPTGNAETLANVSEAQMRTFHHENVNFSEALFLVASAMPLDDMEKLVATVFHDFSKSPKFHANADPHRHTHSHTHISSQTHRPINAINNRIGSCQKDDSDCLLKELSPAANVDIAMSIPQKASHFLGDEEEDSREFLDDPSDDFTKELRKDRKLRLLQARLAHPWSGANDVFFEYLQRAEPKLSFRFFAERLHENCLEDRKQSLKPGQTLNLGLSSVGRVSFVTFQTDIDLAGGERSNNLESSKDVVNNPSSLSECGGEFRAMVDVYLEMLRANCAHGGLDELISKFRSTQRFQRHATPRKALRSISDSVVYLRDMINHPDLPLLFATAVREGEGEDDDARLEPLLTIIDDLEGTAREVTRDDFLAFLTDLLESANHNPSVSLVLLPEGRHEKRQNYAEKRQTQATEAAMNTQDGRGKDLFASSGEGSRVRVDLHLPDPHSSSILKEGWTGEEDKNYRLYMLVRRSSFAAREATSLPEKQQNLAGIHDAIVSRRNDADPEFEPDNLCDGFWHASAAASTHTVGDTIPLEDEGQCGDEGIFHSSFASHQESPLQSLGFVWRPATTSSLDMFLIADFLKVVLNTQFSDYAECGAWELASKANAKSLSVFALMLRSPALTTKFYETVDASLGILHQIVKDENPLEALDASEAHQNSKHISDRSSERHGSDGGISQNEALRLWAKSVGFDEDSPLGTVSTGGGDEGSQGDLPAMWRDLLLKQVAYEEEANANADSATDGPAPDNLESLNLLVEASRFLVDSDATFWPLLLREVNALDREMKRKVTGKHNHRNSSMKEKNMFLENENTARKARREPGRLNTFVSHVKDSIKRTNFDIGAVRVVMINAQSPRPRLSEAAEGDNCQWWKRFQTELAFVQHQKDQFQVGKVNFSKRNLSIFLRPFHHERTLPANRVMSDSASLDNDEAGIAAHNPAVDAVFADADVGERALHNADHGSDRSCYWVGLIGQKWSKPEMLLYNSILAKKLSDYLFFNMRTKHRIGYVADAAAVALKDDSLAIQIRVESPYKDFDRVTHLLAQTTKDFLATRAYGINATGGGSGSGKAHIVAKAGDLDGRFAEYEGEKEDAAIDSAVSHLFFPFDDPREDLRFQIRMAQTHSRLDTDLIDLCRRGIKDFDASDYETFVRNTLSQTPSIVIAK